MHENFSPTQRLVDMRERERSVPPGELHILGDDINLFIGSPFVLKTGDTRTLPIYLEDSPSLSRFLEGKEPQSIRHAARSGHAQAGIDTTLHFNGRDAAIDIQNKSINPIFFDDVDTLPFGRLYAQGAQLKGQELEQIIGLIRGDGVAPAIANPEVGPFGVLLGIKKHFLRQRVESITMAHLIPPGPDRARLDAYLNLKQIEEDVLIDGPTTLHIVETNPIELPTDIALSIDAGIITRMGTGGKHDVRSHLSARILDGADARPNGDADRAIRGEFIGLPDWILCSVRKQRVF